MLSEEKLKQWDETLSKFVRRTVLNVDRKHLVEFLATIRELQAGVAEQQREDERTLTDWSADLDRLEARVAELETWQRGVREAANTLEDFHCEGTPGGFRDAEGYEAGDETRAFFTEAYLYNLIWKEDARTLLHRVKNLRQAIESAPVVPGKGET